MKTLSRYPLLFATAFLMLVAGATYSCKDFLDAAPQGALDDQTLANRQGIEGSLIAAYRALDWNNAVGGGWGSAVSNWVWASVTSDDAYKGSTPADIIEITEIELYNWDGAGPAGELNDKWRAVYEGVVRSNATLRLLDRVLAETPGEFVTRPGEVAETVADSIRGEALFLRAHYHFEAWRMWGNIPYYFEDDQDFRKPNDLGVDAVGQLIEDDLDEAIALLPLTPRNGQVGRATQWTAKAYKGRVQVYRGNYAGALTTLRDVRDNGPYDLELNFHRVWTGFAQFANGPETIFGYQASSNDGEPNGNNANYGERLNFPYNPSPFQCCGFHQPSQNLVNFFRVDANGLPLALTDPNWNASDAEFDASQTAPVDPRFDWTVGRDGVPYKDWGPHQPDWIRDPAFSGPYSPKKNAHESASGAQQLGGGWQPQQQNSVNIHIYRYADLLLLLAEAEVEAGDLNEALAIVNEIRTRAGVAAQGPGTSTSNIAVPINDASITWANYQIGLYPSFADQATARAAVRAERRLELAMEGHRFFDLRRWGIAAQVLNDYIAVEQNRRPYLAGARQVTSDHNLYPIPALQIELSRVGGQNMLTQNPGW